MRRRRLPDLLALLWIVLVTAIYLSPALVHHGLSFGPFDLGASLSGLGHPGAPYANGWLGDQIEEFIPWAYFDWQSLHHLQFPLWNPHVALGLPQFFNFQSSVLSLPELFGYLFPPSASTLVAVALKLLIAGTGAYVFARCLGLEPWAAAFAATTWELCGPFITEIGWPLGDVMAWAGWILAGTHLAWHGRRLALALPLLALSVAFAVYGGFPEGTALLFGACWLYLALLAVQGRRAIGPAVTGWACGLALAAPLWLPGLQLVGVSGRSAVSYPALPLSALITALVPRYFGSSSLADGWFGPISYSETVAYVGLVALVAAGVGLYASRARREVRALALTALVLLIAAYQVGPTAWLLTHVPHLAAVALGRGRIPLAFILSILAGYGIQTVVREGRRLAVRRAFTIAVGVVGVALALVAAHIVYGGSSGLTVAESRVHTVGLIWPLLTLALLVLVAGWLQQGGWRPGWLFAVLMAGETAFLLAFGIGLNVYSPQFLPETAAEHALLAHVGTSLVGLAVPAGSVSQYPHIGVIPELNVAYGLNEFAIYDPMLPASYFREWADLTHTPVASGGWFVPSVSSAATARLFGIGYVLAAAPPQAVLNPAGMAALASTDLLRSQDLAEVRQLAQRYASQPALQAAVPFGETGFAASLLAHDGTPALAPLAAAARGDPALAAAISDLFSVPPWNGMTFVAEIGGESLWQVPGAARFSFAAPADRVAAARPVGNAAWSLAVEAPEASQLIVRLTSVPGWHASINGRPAALTPYLHVMQALQVPAGAHSIRLWYWPRLFTVGLWLAAAGALGLLWAAARSRRRPAS